MEMLWMLAAVIVVLYLSYRCSRFIAVRGSGFAGASANEMRLLSRLSLGQDKQLALVEAGGRYWLLGISSAGIQLIAELTEEQAGLCTKKQENTGKVPEFRDILREGLSNLGKKDKNN